MRTKGLSNKIVPPVLAAVAALVGPWITTGHLDRQMASGLAVALIGVVAAYFTAADEVVSTDDELTPPRVIPEVGGGLWQPMATTQSLSFKNNPPAQMMSPDALANTVEAMRRTAGISGKTIAIPDTVVDEEVEVPDVGTESEATHALSQVPVMPSQVAPEGEPDEVNDDLPHESVPLDVLAAEEPAPDPDASSFRDPGVKGDPGA